jgi:hypothetical protein
MSRQKNPLPKPLKDKYLAFRSMAINGPINADQWLGNRQKVALAESKQPQTQKHGFPHCSTMPKTIDRTKKSPTQPA